LTNSAWQAIGARKKFMKPGPAMATLATSSFAGIAATIACARSRGLRLAAFASCIATLEAKSP
jgi:hypothetical protein